VPLQTCFGGFVKHLAIVVFVVVAAALFYRSFGSAETGTGSLTLPKPAPNVGDNAPGFRVKSVDDRVFELSDKGVYVLTFWSTLNKDSNEAVSGFEDLAREYEDDEASFAVVYVNSAPRVPRLFVVQDGTIGYAQDYYYEGYENTLREAIDEALASEPEKGRQSALRGQEPNP
jgi:hypothetical protein